MGEVYDGRVNFEISLASGIPGDLHADDFILLKFKLNMIIDYTKEVSCLLELLVVTQSRKTFGWSASSGRRSGVIFCTRKTK